MLASMFGLHGFEGWPDKAARVVASRDPLLVLVPLLGCWLLPNTQEIFRRYRPTISPLPRSGRKWWQWRPTPLFAGATVLLMVVIGINFDKVSEFIYFQF
jgi:hypothetical protein